MPGQSRLPQMQHHRYICGCPGLTATLCGRAFRAPWAAHDESHALSIGPPLGSLSLSSRLAQPASADLSFGEIHLRVLLHELFEHVLLALLVRRRKAGRLLALVIHHLLDGLARVAVQIGELRILGLHLPYWGEGVVREQHWVCRLVVGLWVIDRRRAWEEVETRMASGLTLFPSPACQLHANSYPIAIYIRIRHRRQAWSQITPLLQPGP